MVYGAGVLLLAAVAGYWVLERAAMHQGNLKRIGQLLGGSIIVVSLIGIACRVWALTTGKAGYGGKGWCCPFTQQPSPPSSKPQ